MNFKPKKWQIITCVILLLLIILNPSLKDFREYTGDAGVTKKMNFLILSVYEDGGDDYLAFLLNFIKLPHISYSTNTTYPSQVDSSASPTIAISNEPSHIEYDTAAISRLVREYSKSRKNKGKKNKDSFILDSTDTP
jgi:hypothetical protein